MRDISFEGLRTEEIPGAGVTTNDGNTSNKTTCTNVFARIYTLQRLKHTHTQTSSPSTNNKQQTTKTVASQDFLRFCLSEDENVSGDRSAFCEDVNYITQGAAGVCG